MPKAPAITSLETHNLNVLNILNTPHHLSPAIAKARLIVKTLTSPMHTAGDTWSQALPTVSNLQAGHHKESIGNCRKVLEIWPWPDIAEPQCEWIIRSFLVSLVSLYPKGTQPDMLNPWLPWTLCVFASLGVAPPAVQATRLGRLKGGAPWRPCHCPPVDRSPGNPPTSPSDLGAPRSKWAAKVEET